MPFGSVLRGRVAERILVTLLERGGYRVTRLGIEEIFDEIKLLSLHEYQALGLSKQLRTLPDLLVSDPAVSWAALVEVKYRRTFDLEVARELHSTISEQRKYWPESYTVIMIAEPFVEGGRFHQDYIRLIKPGELERLSWRPPNLTDLSEHDGAERVWRQLPTIASLLKAEHFNRNTEEGQRKSWDFFASMDYITNALKELRHF